MTARIHPTAVVDKGAELDDEVEVGAYAWIGPSVRLGRGTVVAHHATVDGNTRMGEGNEIHPYAFVGGKTHDLKYSGGAPGLVVGHRNVFREYATVHCATSEGDDTVLGDDNLILAYSHIAHDCRIGNRLIMSSHAALGGHVKIGDRVNLAWNSGVHQFCRIGDHAMVGADSKVVQDVPPFFIVDGNPAMVRTINKVGLERAGFSPSELALVRRIFKIFYRDGLNRSQALERLRASADAEHPLAMAMAAFVEASERGVS